MEFKTNVTIGLKPSTVQDLDKIVTIKGLSSRSELGRQVFENYLAQKKIRELLINN